MRSELIRGICYQELKELSTLHQFFNKINDSILKI